MMKKFLIFICASLLLWGCENNPEPENPNPGEGGGVVVSPELLQKVTDLNAGLGVMKGLVAAVGESSVTSVEPSEQGVALTFRNGVQLVLPCEATALEPALIGITDKQDGYYWTLASESGAPLLLDADGKPMAVGETLPVIGVDVKGFWTVAQADAPAWPLLSAAGEPIAASEGVRTALFRSVESVGDLVRITLADGTPLQAGRISGLSEAGTSNSYIVSAAGQYFFDASVRGNGIGTAAATGHDPQIDLSGEVRADWLWASAEGVVSEVAFDKTSATISFKAGAGSGNALVALLRGDEIIWSWHIWMTEQPATMAYANGAVFMDRNLGAVGATPGGTDAYGMYYQWGRKEPFYGGEKTETSAEAFLQAKNNTVVNPAYADLTWVYSKSVVTAAVAAAHPMIFYNNKVGVGYDWIAAPKATLWGAAKNLNDPCPVGYKVPETAAWESISAGRDYIDGVSAWDAVNYGMTYTFGGQTAWYPAQGYRNYASGSIVGLRGSTGGSGAYWTSDASSAKSYYLFFKKQLSSSSGSINLELDKERSWGYTVRCCKE